MAESKIEWTDATWNPVTGCTKVSPGCERCYAMKQSRRCALMGQEKYDGVVTMAGSPRWTNLVRCHPEELEKPLRWRKPRQVFVNSMGDLFHEDVPFDFIDQVFAVTALCPQHQFQVLTKRPERMVEYLNTPHRWDIVADEAACPICHGHSIGEECECKARGVDVDTWPLPNVWLGTSVENQAVADERIPKLLGCPAAVRFLSCEPLLGDLNLRDVARVTRGGQTIIDCLTGRYVNAVSGDTPALPGVDWVIVGGESGVGARPMHPDWVRGVRDQCVSAGVPFFFKQWGEWAPSKDLFDRGVAPGDSREPWGKCQPRMDRVGKKAAGRELDGRVWDEMPG